MKKTLLLIAGWISLALGIVGIVVPLLPTTPFLLLAAVCFLRSSPRLHHWLTHHRLFGNYIRCYQQFQAVSARAKIWALVLLWAAIGYASVFMVMPLWVRIVLVVIAIGVTVHIVRLRTLTREMIEQLK